MTLCSRSEGLHRREIYRPHSEFNMHTKKQKVSEFIISLEDERLLLRRGGFGLRESTGFESSFLDRIVATMKALRMVVSPKAWH